jgi:hypothetical protein
MARRTLFYSVLFGHSDVTKREYVTLHPLGSLWWWMQGIVFDPVGVGGCAPLVMGPHSLAVLKIHSTPSGPRMSRGSSIRPLVSVSITAFAHSVGVAYVKVSMAAMSTMGCCAACLVMAVVGRAVAAMLLGCHV